MTQRARTVLMTADAVGGVWSYALGLCAALPDVQFVLATLGPRPGPAQRAALVRLDNVILAESDFRLEWMSGGEADIAASRRWLERLADRHGVDLVHVNGYAQAALDGARPVVAVAHSDVLSWWRAVHGEPAPAAWREYRRQVACGLRAAARVVAPTTAVLDDLRREYGPGREYGVPAGNAAIIANGVDIGALSLAPKRRAIMAAGRIWDEAKNLLLLDAIAPRLAWPVEIAGDTAHPEHGVAELRHARALGVLDAAQMQQRLGEVAIFAAPARYEPFGLGILEAAAAGCALVLGDIASLRESWDGAALFVPPDDPGKWRAALARLIEDADERAANGLAAAGRARAERFHDGAHGARYRALYRELPGCRRRGRPAGRVMARLALFCHSLRSDWNHGNAHFLRGVVSELGRRGVAVRVFEPEDGWSAANLAADLGPAALAAWRAAYPDLPVTPYDRARFDLDRALDGVDVALVHEWNDPALIAGLAARRRAGARTLLLFHDTHHRMASAPDRDGTARSRRVRRGARVWRGAERGLSPARLGAAGVHLARGRRSPRVPSRSAATPIARDLLWIGNWGDDERAAELHEFLIEPVAALGLRARVHGVRYPAAARAALIAAGIDYAGYLANFRVPQAFAASRMTIHVPRRPYARMLPGIPTIRMFEALACGVPLVSAPWDDCEALFTAGEDYLVARDGAEMRRHLAALRADPALRTHLAEHGRATVAARHSCAHRVDELLAICAGLGRDLAMPAMAAAS